MSPRTAETALKRRLGREKFSTGSCRRMNTVSNAAGDGNATRNQPGRPERRVVGWRGEHQTPTVSQLKARKKDGYRLLGSRLSINRLSSELSFDANRFQLMIIVR